MKKITLFYAIASLLISISLSESASAQYIKLLDFENTPYGFSPRNSVICIGDFLYGSTGSGGINDYGTLYKIKKDGTSYARILNFTGNLNGSGPMGELFFDGTYLYGVTFSGGNFSKGIIYKILPNGTGFTKIYSFSGGTGFGSKPHAGLVSDGTFLYGTTLHEGTGTGTVYKIKPDGTNFLTLYNFGGTAGMNPYGSLLYDGYFLYGTTKGGGINDFGTIFKIKTDGTNFTKILDFEGAINGKFPYCNLIADSAYLYGTTYLGGNNDMGIVFRIKRDGTDFSKLVDFAGFSNGAYPYSSLVSAGDFLYGTTSSFGSYIMGVIFKVKKDGTNYSKELDFSGYDNGTSPLYGSPAFDGTALFGTTNLGGINDQGTLYKYGISDTTQNVVTQITDITPTDLVNIYPSPAQNKIYIEHKSSTSKYLVKIYNAIGAEVLNVRIEQTESIDISNFSNGIYIVEVENNRVKFVKE
jgi:uncharacterized repeat protein (TIGR03803 family)